jgi:hypothetical protein
MLNFQPAPFRPGVLPPTLGPVRQIQVRPVHTLGAERALGQTFDEIMGWTPVVGDVIRLTFHGIATYLGILVGLQGHKLPIKNKTVRVITVGAGWALAGGQGLGAIADIVSLTKRALGVHPPDQPSPKVSDISPIPPVR